jgi:hypothetical protein
MHSQSEATSRILQVIEHIECKLAKLKGLVYEVISQEDIGGNIFVDAAFAETSGLDIIIDVQVIEDSKPNAKPSKKDHILKARHLAREWAESLERNKRSK